MTELEKYQEQNKAQTLQIIQLLQEIEQLKAYRAITEQAIGFIHVLLKQIEDLEWSIALEELENCITELNKLEGQG